MDGGGLRGDGSWEDESGDDGSKKKTRSAAALSSGRIEQRRGRRRVAARRGRRVRREQRCFTARGCAAIKQRLRELRSSFPARRTVNPENLSFWDSDPLPVRPEQQDIFGGRYYRHDRYPSPDGFAEIVMFQNSLLMGGRSDLQDWFRGWRLDVDNMTYEL